MDIFEELFDIPITFSGEKGEKGKPGVSIRGKTGLSAYEIWLKNGNIGSEQDFIESLKGEDGKSIKGDKGDAIKGDKGDEGLSAYQLWLKAGNKGTERQFLNSLVGKDGKDGISVEQAIVNDDGELIITKSNGEEVNLGVIKGKDAENQWSTWGYTNLTAVAPLLLPEPHDTISLDVDALSPLITGLTADNFAPVAALTVLIGPDSGEDDATPTFRRLRQSDIGNDFSITSFSSSSATLVLLGATVTNPSFTASYAYTPTSASIQDNAGNPSVNVISTPTAFTYSYAYTKTTYGQSVTWTLTADDGSGADTATDSTTWAQYVYYGVDVAGGSTEAFIKALPSSVLTTTKNRTISVTAGASDKIYYAYRSAYGTATFTVGGFAGGFGTPTTISVTNAYGIVENYYLYESEQLNLGATTVVIT